MKDVLQKAVKVAELLEENLAEAQAIINKNVELRARMDKELEAIKERTAILDAREIEVKKVEDVIALGIDAQNKLDEAKKIMEEARRLSKATGEYEKVVQAELDKRASIVHAKEESVKSREVNVARKEAEIEEVITTKIKEILKN